MTVRDREPTTSADITAPPSALAHARIVIHRAVVAPIKAFRLVYLPLLMVYFAYGALGLIAVAQSFFEKKGLTLTPVDLAKLGVWLALPWAIKMVFGELVDTVALARLAAAGLRVPRRRARRRPASC